MLESITKENWSAECTVLIAKMVWFLSFCSLSEHFVHILQKYSKIEWCGPPLRLSEKRLRNIFVTSWQYSVVVTKMQVLVFSPLAVLFVEMYWRANPILEECYEATEEATEEVTDMKAFLFEKSLMITRNFKKWLRWTLSDVFWIAFLIAEYIFIFKNFVWMISGWCETIKSSAGNSIIPVRVVI